MNFSAKKFKTLSAYELHNILKLRAAVFVVEQHCAYQDPDDKDAEAIHILGYAGSELVATARLLPAGISYAVPAIGRVVVAQSFRRRGIGRELMEYCIQVCSKEFQAKEIVISAQCYLETFYKSLGFKSEGESYLEDGIPHIQMRYHSF